MPAAIVPVRDYQKLLTKIQRILASAQGRIEREKARAYWKIGRELHTFILKHQKRAPRGKRVIEKLAKERGMNKTALYHALEFFRAYPIFPTLGKLGWSHYRYLLSLNDTEKRKCLRLEAAKRNWSVRELKSAIKRFKALQSHKAVKRLVPRRGKVGVYRIIDWRGKKAYDLGFSSYLEISKKSKKKSTADQAALYTYEADLERVVDGDTLWARIHLGFGVWTRQKLRLRGIDAPEMNSSAGKEAKKYLQRLLKDTTTFVLRTTRSDKFDRYLADIFAGTTYINQALIDAGHARRV